MDARALFDKMAVDLAEDDVSTGRMFGADALITAGQAFAFLVAEDMAFKLGRGTVLMEETLDLPGAGLFDPGQSGRLWRDWVLVPIAECNEWERLAAQARRFVGGQT